MPGSFTVSRDQLEQQARDNKNIEALKKAQEQPEPEAESKEEKARIAEVDSRLPEIVFSDFYGKLPYADFKAKYAHIWEQVNNKDNLLTQRIKHTVKFGPTTVSVQSLTKREQKALTFFEPAAATEGSAANTRDQQMEYSILRLILQVQQIGTTSFPDIRLTPETREKWRNDPAIKQQYDYLLDLDPIYFSQLLAILTDVDQAKYFALIENLKNP